MSERPPRGGRGGTRAVRAHPITRAHPIAQVRADRRHPRQHDARGQPCAQPRVPPAQMLLQDVRGGHGDAPARVRRARRVRLLRHRRPPHLRPLLHGVKAPPPPARARRGATFLIRQVGPCETYARGVIKHGDMTIAVVEQGQIGFAQDKGQPVCHVHPPSTRGLYTRPTAVHLPNMASRSRTWRSTSRR